jgi:hypothetical protein
VALFLFLSFETAREDPAVAGQAARPTFCLFVLEVEIGAIRSY